MYNFVYFLLAYTVPYYYAHDLCRHTHLKSLVLVNESILNGLDLCGDDREN